MWLPRYKGWLILPPPSPDTVCMCVSVCVCKIREPCRHNIIDVFSSTDRNRNMGM